MLSDYSTPPGTISLLQSLRADGIIETFYISPDHRKLLKNHLFTHKIAGELRAYGFDLWMAGSEVQVTARFLLECVLPDRCVSVLMWHNLTFLFMYNPTLAGKLLAGEDIPPYPVPRERIKVQRRSPPVSRGLRRRSISANAVPPALARGPRWMFNVLNGRRVVCWKRLRNFFDRSVLPLLLLRRTFQLGPYDAMTQIGSGRSDMLILFDELEAKAHQRLYPKVRVVVAEYPTVGCCRCEADGAGRSGILSPLSNFVGMERIGDDVLSLFYRDFQTVLDQTGARFLDLRVHPDESGHWPYQLRDFLVERGMDVRIVKPVLPIREVVCDYLAVAGSASAALRDCRAVCDSIVVIGFVGVSKRQLADPEFAFAGSDGIAWIDDDGSYETAIFANEGREKGRYQTVAQILNEIAEGGVESRTKDG